VIPGNVNLTSVGTSDREQVQFPIEVVVVAVIATREQYDMHEFGYVWFG